MNNEKVISNIKKAIKEHLDNNYTHDMLVDFELDVIDWNSLFEYIDKLQQENKILKENTENNDKAVDKVNWENQLLKEENQELRLELSGYRQAILEDKDILGLKEENQELKKQLEDKTELSNEIINKIKYEIISQCIEDKEIEKLLTIIERVRWNI